MTPAKSRGPSSGRRREIVPVVLGYSALTVVLFRPTLPMLAATVPGFGGKAEDALMLVWAIEHVSRTLFTDPRYLFDAPIFWPARFTLAYGDHMIGQALLGLPAWWVSSNPVLVFNLVALASYPLSAACTYAWLRTAGMSAAAAAAGGLVVAFTPLRLHGEQWLQLLVVGFLPLALRSWVRFLAWQRWRDWAGWVGWWALHSLMGMYLALYGAVVFGALGPTGLLVARPSARTRTLLGTVAAPLAVGLLLAPTLWPYLAVRRQYGFERTRLRTPLEFLLPAADTWTAWLTGLTSPLAQGPGAVVLALAVLGMATRSARRGPLDLPIPPSRLRLLAAVGLVVSLACLLVPIDLLARMPGFDMLRTNSRALLVSLVFAAFFVAAGVDRLLAGLRHAGMRAGLALLLLTGLVADGGRPARERIPAAFGRDLPEVDRWIVDHLPRGTPVYEITFTPEATTRGMLWSLRNGTRLVNGYSGYAGPGHEYLTVVMAQFPESAGLEVLYELGVRWIVGRQPPPGTTLPLASLDVPPWLRLAARFPDGVVWEMHEPPPRPPRVEVVRPLDRAAWRLHESAPTGTLSRLVDGDRATAWRLASRGAGTPSLTVDLGAVQPVTALRAAAMTSRPAGLYLAQIATSEDGLRWQETGASFRPEDVARFFADPRRVDAWVAHFPPRRARWIRLTNPLAGFWGGVWEMAELEVLAADDRPAPERRSSQAGRGVVGLGAAPRSPDRGAVALGCASGGRT